MMPFCANCRAVNEATNCDVLSLCVCISVCLCNTILCFRMYFRHACATLVQSSGQNVSLGGGGGGGEGGIEAPLPWLGPGLHSKCQLQA